MTIKSLALAALLAATLPMAAMANEAPAQPSTTPMAHKTMTAPDSTPAHQKHAMKTKEECETLTEATQRAECLKQVNEVKAEAGHSATKHTHQ